MKTNDSRERVRYTVCPSCLSLPNSLPNNMLCRLLPSEVMVGMGFTPEEIKDALLNQKYNEVTATYLLLGLKSEVSCFNKEKKKKNSS